PAASAAGRDRARPSRGGHLPQAAPPALHRTPRPPGPRADRRPPGRAPRPGTAPRTGSRVAGGPLAPRRRRLLRERAAHPGRPADREGPRPARAGAESTPARAEVRQRPDHPRRRPGGPRETPDRRTPGAD